MTNLTRYVLSLAVLFAGSVARSLWRVPRLKLPDRFSPGSTNSAGAAPENVGRKSQG